MVELIKAVPMSTLLVQSCSKSKNCPSESVPALQLYSGYFFKIIKKAIDDGAMPESLDICILSAEHGLVDANEEIGWYDRRIDEARATEIAPNVRRRLSERVADGYDRVVINVGRDYRTALTGVEEELNVPVHYVQGGGIGEKGAVLKRLVRGNAAAILEDADGTLVAS